METTGRPLTVKCFSIFWPVPKAAAGRRRIPTPSTGSKVRFHFDEYIMTGDMLINAPSAIKHRGQQFGFLLISNRQILARQFVVGIFLQAFAAIINELIQ